jgi:threonine dehydrogenase-like Zn-dependent dehydrogenase
MTQAIDTPPAKPAAPSTMRAAVVTAPLALEIREVPLAPLRGNEVRVRIEGCGVCASNVPPWEGRDWFHYPLRPGQLGHEAWGVVEKVGSDVRKVRPGERVAMISENGYAEFDVTPEDSLVLLPDSLAGRPFPAEPLGCAMNILRRCQIQPGDRVAIIGIGFLGSLLTRLVTESGGNVIAIARKQSALDAARAMGATQAIPMDDHWKIIETVRLATGGRFCDIVIECVGKQWPLDLAAEITRERGRLVVAGYHQDGPRQVNMQLWNWRGIDVINAHERDPKLYLRGMNEAVRAVETGLLDPTPLYTHTFPLEQLDVALEMTRTRPDGFMKALVLMK